MNLCDIKAPIAFVTDLCGIILMVRTTQCNHKSIVTRLHASLSANTCLNKRQNFSFRLWTFLPSVFHNKKVSCIEGEIWLFIRV